MSWAISVDASACTGSGLCVGCAPAHFELDETQHTRARTPVIEPDDAVAAAAECCPMEAIRVTDTATGTALYPQDVA